MATFPKFNFSMTEPGEVKIKDLMPGDVALGFAGESFKTLLGSCVSVILTDPRRTVGAMCHIVHVSHPNAANRDNTAYGSVAMQKMFLLLSNVGINPNLCHAFLYGGGNMFPHISQNDHVGARNSRWAMQFLADHKIPLISHLVKGAGYRKVSWTVGLLDPLVETVMVQQEISNGD